MGTARIRKVLFRFIGRISTKNYLKNLITVIKKLNKIVGLKKTEFDNFITEGQIHIRNAQLIPTFKVGDELSLTSIFLASLRLVKEFRTSIFSELKLPKGGKVHYYTEASFLDIDSKSRIDGFLIVVVGGVIKDAVFFEMKNKNNLLEDEQISRYIDLAKALKITKVVTVSNQFVSDSTQSPLKLRVPKSISLSHLSWTYIKTIGQLLLYKNEKNIEDVDQVEIMREVLSYLDSPVSGVTGFNQMKPGWSQIVEYVNSNHKILKSDSNLEEAIVSWHQEERDMSLILSKELGSLVKSTFGGKKLNDRVKNDITSFVKTKKLKSSLVVKRAVSNIDVVADFNTRTISMSVKLTPPLDKGTKAKVTWLNRQLDSCRKKQEELFTQNINNLWVEANIKYTQNDYNCRYTDLSDMYDEIVKKDIIDFKLTLIYDLGKKFSANRKLVEILEKMLLDFYKCYVQNLKNWTRPVPKIDNE